MEKTIIKEVYTMLQNREVHPSGRMDSKKRFYALNNYLINVRSPSAAWPFSHMIACRTLKYVTKVAEKFNCTTKEELLSNI